MANQLTMAEINAILTLHESEHSYREIARLLGVHRETIGKYVAGREAQNRPNAPPGSPAAEEGGPPPSTTGPPMGMKQLPKRLRQGKQAKASNTASGAPATG